MTYDQIAFDVVTFVLLAFEEVTFFYHNICFDDSWSINFKDIEVGLMLFDEVTYNPIAFNAVTFVLLTFDDIKVVEMIFDDMTYYLMAFHGMAFVWHLNLWHLF